jgi:8-oxo-dGTP pyrophosphatase MutT (NUDIX family)
VAGEKIIKQYGAIPYRVGKEGEIRIVLVTSRETRRWVIPRGNPIRGLSPAASAAREAFEEAGVEGLISEAPVGHYSYGKRRKSGSLATAQVTLFAMEVTRQLDDWPERRERERSWFTPDEAAKAVHEQDLALLFSRMQQMLPA